MKLKSARIENFKGVKEVEIDFMAASTGEPRPVTCLIGDNGSGKTTVLQAIAMVLSLATRRTHKPNALDWPGFQAERTGTFGKTRVELEVAFDEEELRLVHELYDEGKDLPGEHWVSVNTTNSSANDPNVRVVYDGNPPRQTAWSTNGRFLGRHLLNILSESKPEKKTLIKKIGDVFWFTQIRSLGTSVRSRRRESWNANVSRLRESLIGWWGYHTSQSRKNDKDHIELLEEHFNRVFPGTRFLGIEPRANVADPGPLDFYFLLERDGKVYDIAEMSSGEQALFPLIYEFVRLDIAKSIVLIDELEQQQALLSALRKLGPDCQYIITTHSPYLEEVIPDEEEVRLPGGSACL